jgi:hypothetical protein
MDRDKMPQLLGHRPEQFAAVVVPYVDRVYDI